MLEKIENYNKVQSFAKEGLKKQSPLANSFRYAKIKHNTLFFVFDSHIAKSEFKYKKEGIKEALRAVHKSFKEDLKPFKEIEAVVIFKAKTELKVESKKQVYIERSTGAFKNSTKDADIHKRLEEIRAIIRGRL